MRKCNAKELWRRARTLPKEKILVISAFAVIITVAVQGARNIDLIPVFNLILLAGLIAVTAIYAYSTLQIARHTREQAKEVREQRIMASRPVIIQKAVHEGSTPYYFAHFEVYNTDNGPAIELEISVLDKERTPIHSHRESFLRADDSIKFRPFAPHLNESTIYYLTCEYQSIFSRGAEQTWYQTWLPFEVVKSSKVGKIYVKAGELSFEDGVTENERIDAFRSREKPK